MVTMVRNCIADSTIWGACFKPPQKCLQFRKEKHVRMYWKHSFRDCSTFNSVGEVVAGAENEQPPWKWRLVISYDGTRYSGVGFLPSKMAVTAACSHGSTDDRGRLVENYTIFTQPAEGCGSRPHRCWRPRLGSGGAFHDSKLLQYFGTVARISEWDSTPDIRIREICPVHPDFHARFSACRKTYQYKAYVSPVMDPCQFNYSHHVKNPLNVEAMKAAASYFVGVHNFSAFANASADTAARGVLREILRFNILSTGPQLLFEVEGKSFQYKQVRNMVGLLIEVGKELVPPHIVQTILLTEDRKELAKVSPVAPPHGLYLMSVAYIDKVLEPLPNTPQASFGRWLRCPVRTLA